MKRVIVCAIVLCTLAAASTIAHARKVQSQQPRFRSVPPQEMPLPPDVVGLPSQGVAPARAPALADTFLLHEADFDNDIGTIDYMGYTKVDRTIQTRNFFHVADGFELNGGATGRLAPLSGNKSGWCGAGPNTPPQGTFCSYASLPGYGNNWDQTFTSNPLIGDSASISYKVFFDTEANYDGTVVEYTFNGGQTWTQFAVTDTFGLRPGVYEGRCTEPYLDESFTFSSPGASNVRVRFRFVSDGAWSDEDGLIQTDGAITIDDIHLQTWQNGVPAQTRFQDFETRTTGAGVAGIWVARSADAFGDFAEVYPGIALLQEDPCVFDYSFVWGFFDDPAVTSYDCHLPEPRSDVGAMPYGTEATGISGGGYFGSGQLYMSNEIWSPPFDNIGNGDQYLLYFSAYRDLPLDNLQFYVWHVRSWVNGCPGPWRDDNYTFYGDSRDWIAQVENVGTYVEPGAEQIQIAIGAVDMCFFWCNVYGSGACHSHAPLIDNIKFERVGVTGPQFTVRHIDLFQDNFAEDGTLTGTARADAAIDILPAETLGILPGDSIAISVAPVGADQNTGVGPAVYAHVAVWPLNQPGKTPADLESPETRAGVGKRYPLLSTSTIDGVPWSVFRMDTATIGTTTQAPNRYCFDLNDNLFTPGDTIRYFFSADADGVPGNGNEVFWYRSYGGQGYDRITTDINVAVANSCEFTILPAGGYNRGGDILYVDDVDDRGGPVQAFFDNAFDFLGIRDLVDRYDVLGPSSAVGNGLASRVKDYDTQIINVYRNIIWNSGTLPSALIGDGSVEKSNDFALLYQFLHASDMAPCLYVSGDNVASEWISLAGPSAIDLRSLYMNFNVLTIGSSGTSSHIEHGESLSPELVAMGSMFTHAGGPDHIIAFGGCPLINSFDVLQPTGDAVMEFPYPKSGDGAVISQETPNSIGSPATVILSGFSFHSIADPSIEYPLSRPEHLRDIMIRFGQVVAQPTGIGDDEVSYANALHAAYPNPFNPATTIRYTIKDQGHVSLKVYNAAGQLVATLVDDVQSPGEAKPVKWYGQNNAGQTVSSGVYFYKLVTKGFTQTRKMVLLK